MYTRKQYMNREVSHQEYYLQFSTPMMVSAVYFFIGKNPISNSKDKHMNDIALCRWDKLPNYCDVSLMYKLGETPSKATKVCVAKAIAKELKESYLQRELVWQVC